jgi:hypothetical protein
MSSRSLNWLKFGGLVALAFALGLLFAGLLDLPSRSSAQEAQVASAIPAVPAADYSGRQAAGRSERRVFRGSGSCAAERRLHPGPAYGTPQPTPAPARNGAVLSTLRP